MEIWLTHLFFYIIAFLGGVFGTRWIFRIDKIVSSLTIQTELAIKQEEVLKKQLDNSQIQVLLLRRLLTEKGVSNAETENIIAKRNNPYYM